MFRCLTFLLLFSLSCANSEPNLGGSIEISLEYSVEVNKTTTPTVESAVLMFENETVATINEVFRNSSAVRIGKIETEFLGTCNSTRSDLCSIVESNVSVALGVGTDAVIAELAILNLIHSFFVTFNSENPSIYVTLLGPFVVWTNIIVRLEGVSRVMNDAEIQTFEMSLTEVLRPVSKGIVTVVLQILNSGKRRLRALPVGGISSGSNRVYTTIGTSCRSCTDSQFATEVNEVFDQNREDFRLRLVGSQDHGTNYFQAVDITRVTQTENPSPANSLRTFIPTKQKSFPYWVLVVFGAAVLVVAAGTLYAIVCGQRGGSGMLAMERQKHLDAQQRGLEAANRSGCDSVETRRIANLSSPVD